MAILILSFFGYFAWNSFRMPIIFLGKTEKIKGTIYNIKDQPGLKGYGFVQNLNYFYSFKGSWYEGQYTCNGRQSLQRIGNSISLKISAANPHKVQVIGFYEKKKYKKSKKEKFYSVRDKGHCKLTIEDNIYTLINFTESSDSTTQTIGIVKFINGDTLKLLPIKSLIKKGKETKESIIPDSLRSILKKENVFQRKQNGSETTLINRKLEFKKIN
ncbi:hypothetical protein [Labilibaculum sp.]|uniref:hypothetical protein n=1 Tax=Labilibaculum sp. TaxID=2060723 RepID=UPI002AA82C56|nr:hypothetical protein [Labilibaculum sp.]